MSINKIHINSTTKMSLNDRFTVMQSVGPKMPAPVRKVPRRRTQSASLDRSLTNTSLANRKFLEQLDKKHKMRAALKLKRKSMKATVPNGPRIRNRIGLRKGATTAIRLRPGGRLSRSNSLTNIATMKADLVQPALRRSNSTSSLAGRLGVRRASTGGGGGGAQASAGRGRPRIKRNNIVRSNSRQSLSRSNSQTNLARTNSRASQRRSNSRTNLKRSNSKMNLNRAAQRSLPARNRLAQRFRPGNRAPASTRRSNSVAGRLGIKRTPMVRDRIRATRNVRGQATGVRGRGGARGRIFNRRNSNVAVSNRIKSGARQERVGRQRGRGNANAPRGRSRSRSRARNNGPRQNTGRGNRSSSRGRGRNNARGKGTRPALKREDLDKELDQYMSTTRTGLDMDTL